MGATLTRSVFDVDPFTEQAQPQSVFDADPFAEQEPDKQQAMADAIESITGGQGFGSSITRGALHFGQAMSRPLAWLGGDTEQLNEQMAATQAAEKTRLGGFVQGATALAGEMAVLGPVMEVPAAALGATRLGQAAAGGSRLAGATVGTLQGGATGAILGGLEGGLKEAPHSAAFLGIGGAIGGVVQRPALKALSEMAWYLGGPGVMEGQLRAPTPEEAAYAVLPLLHRVGQIKTPSRSAYEKAFRDVGYEPPKDLSLKEREAIWKEAQDFAKENPQQETPEPRPQQTDEMGQPVPPREIKLEEPPAPEPIVSEVQPREEVIQRAEEVQGRTEEAPPIEPPTSPEQARTQPEPIEPVPAQEPPVLVEAASQAQPVAPQEPPPTAIVPGTKGKGQAGLGIVERTKVIPDSGAATPDQFGNAIESQSFAAKPESQGGIPLSSALRKVSVSRPSSTELLPFDVGAGLAQGPINTRLANRETFGDVLDAISLSPEGFNGLDVTQKRVVQSAVRRAIGDDKVGKSIVSFIPVDVMNDLARGKQSAKTLFDNPSMFLDALPSDVNSLIWSRVVNSLVGLEARSVAKGTGDILESARASGDSGSAKHTSSIHEGKYTTDTGKMQDRVGSAQGEEVGRPPESGATSLKNAVTDAERVARGLEPTEKPGERPWEEVLDDAQSEIAANTNRPTEIIEAIRAGRKKATTDTEEAVILVEKRRLMNERAAASDRASDPKSTDFDRTAAQKQAENIEERINEIDQVTRSIGTETARALAFRKAMMAENYSLEAMEQRARAAKKAPLDPEERAIIKEQADKIAELEGEILRRDASSEIDRVYSTEVSSKGKKPTISESLVKGAEESFKALNELLGGGRVGITPGAFSEDSYTRAKPHLKKAWDAYSEAGSSISDYIRDMGRQFGSKIKPYLERFIVDEKIDVAGMVQRQDKEKAAFTALQEKAKKEKGPIDLKKQRETISERIQSRTEDGDTIEDMRPLIQRLALNFVRESNPSREKLNDMVYDFVSKIMPDITRSNVRQAIANYGVFKELDADPAKAQLRKYKGENRQISKIVDMMKGNPPKASGIEYPEPKAEERRLTKIVNDLKRKGGFESKDRAGHLKSALDAVKTRLRNEITDLDNAIADLKPLPEKRNKLEYDAEANKLREERNALKKQYDELFPKEKKQTERKPLTDEQRISIASRALDRAIERLSSDIAAGDLYNKKYVRKSTPELDAKRAKLDALKDERELLRSLDTARVEADKEQALVKAIAEAKKNEPKPKAERPTVDTAKVAKLKATLAEVRKKNAAVRKAGRDADTMAAESKREANLVKAIERAEKGVRMPKKATVKSKRVAELEAQLAEVRKAKRVERADELNLAAHKANVSRRIAELEQRIVKEDFGPRPKREPKVIKKDSETASLEFQLNKLKQEIAEREFEWKRKHMTRSEKVLDVGENVIGTLRAAKSSIDVSAVGRQGILGFLAHPIIGAKAAIKMSRAMRSEEAEFGIMRDLMKRDNASDYEAAELFMHDPTNPKLSSMEEAFRSRWAKRIPGIAASERAYTTFLNVLRADMYDAMHASLARKGMDTLEAKKMIANYVNVATGRGGGKAFENSARAFSTLLWSPRLTLSRFQYALGQPLWTRLLDNPGAADLNAARKVIATEYARTAAGAALVLGLAAMIPGVSVGTNPQSTDFGKIVIGRKGKKTRIDVLGGLSQAMVFLSRSVPALFMEKTVTDSKGKKKDFDSNAIFQYWRYKASPIVDVGFRLFTHKDAIGRKTSIPETVLTTPLPLSMQQFVEALREDGVSEATIETLVSLTGVGVQTY